MHLIYLAAALNAIMIGADIMAKSPTLGLLSIAAGIVGGVCAVLMGL